MITELFKREKKYIPVYVGFLIFLLCVGATIYELNRAYTPIKMKQPFRIGVIRNGAFVQTQTICLGESIAYEMDYVKTKDYEAMIQDSVQNGFQHSYPPQSATLLPGARKVYKELETSVNWAAGKGYIIAKEVKFHHIGWLNRTIELNFVSEPFAMVVCK